MTHETMTHETETLQTTPKNFLAVHALARRVYEKRSIIPILSMVKIDGGMMTATDLDNEITVPIPASSAGLTACIDASQFVSALKYFDRDEPLTVSREGVSVMARANGSAYQLVTLPASDFPRFPALKGVVTSTSNMGLIDAMGAVFFATSTEKTHYYFNGVCLTERADGQAVAVATNGHIMAIKPMAALPDGAKGTIVPRKAVSILRAMKAEPETMAFDAAAPRFKARFTGNVTLKSNLIDGTFPDFERVSAMAEKDAKPIFAANRAALHRILKRLTSFGDVRGRTVSFCCKAGEPISLSTRVFAADAYATERTHIDHQAGEALKRFGFNGDYLVAALDAFSGCENVEFAGVDASSSFFITSPESDLTILVMPMRV